MTPEIITDYHHARQNAAYYLAIEQPLDAATFTGLADAILQEGPKTHLYLAWYRLESGNYEITAYLS